MAPIRYAIFYKSQIASYTETWFDTGLIRQRGARSAIHSLPVNSPLSLCPTSSLSRSSCVRLASPIASDLLVQVARNALAKNPVTKIVAVEAARHLRLGDVGSSFSTDMGIVKRLASYRKDGILWKAKM